MQLLQGKFLEDSKVCVYTVVIGGYDFVLPPACVQESIDYILFTDQPDIQVDGWNTVLVDRELEAFSPSMVNRHYKMFPFKYLGDYDLSIYIDGNVRVKGDLAPLISKFIESGAKIGLLRHPARRSVGEEVEACINLGKVDSPKVLREEYTYYKSKGFGDDNVLTENNVILRWHKDQSVIIAMKMWWDLMNNSAGRDQISLPYVRDVMQLDEVIFEFDARSDNPYFRVYPHKARRKSVNFGNYLFAKGITSNFYHALYLMYSFCFFVAGKVLRLLRIRKS